MRRLILSTVWAAVVVTALITVPGFAAPEDSKARGKKSSDPFLTGDPFTLDQMLLLLKQDAIPLRRRKEAIESRGISFALSSDTLTRLQSAGASEEILDVIRSKAKPVAVAAAVIPKVVAKGMLSLTCAPAECQVSLNGTSIGPTSGGKLEVAGLTPGNWVVDFKKEGFAGNQSTVVVESAKSALVDSDPRTRSRRARSLRQAVVRENDSGAGRRRRAQDARVGASHRQHHALGA